MNRYLILILCLFVLSLHGNAGPSSQKIKRTNNKNPIVNKESVEQWDVFEIELNSKKKFENPFEDVTLTASFTINATTKKVKGFYDGNSTWKIRFMPEQTGTYTFSLSSDNSDFDQLSGSFQSTAPSLDNHGPVRAQTNFHFSYADGTPCFIMGTTAYGWIFRPKEVRNQTLGTIKKYKFNKVRMGVFPQYFQKTSGENVFKGIDISYKPEVAPYQGKPYAFKYRRFNVEYFRNLEDRIRELMEQGVTADVILFHDYDFGLWGIESGLNDNDAIFYIDYLIARISSLRNVWWSLANEYDLDMPEGKNARSVTDKRDWDRLGNYIMENDPYNHPRSIHEWTKIYPNRPWITHISCQKHDTYDLLMRLKNEYQKPVICDEYRYEGNINHGWGNLKPEEVVLHHWLSVMAGAYATHGDCYVTETNIKDTFFAYGGAMTGKSPARLRFLKEIVDSLPFQKMEPRQYFPKDHDGYCLSGGDDVLVFLLTNKSIDKKLDFNMNGLKGKYNVTVYDAWNCSVVERTLNIDSYDASAIPGLIVIKAIRSKIGK